MHGAILVINAGSSSVKFALFEPTDPPVARLHGQLEGLGASARLAVTAADGRTLADEPAAADAIGAIHHWLAAHGGEAALGAVGHRLVHGGRRYAAPVRIDAQVLTELERLVPLAPLHQPEQLKAIRAMAKVAPQVPQVACFDTAFHLGQPPVAQQFALPRALTARGIHRYGFHGLSYEYIVSVMPQVIAGVPERVVVAHLGSGASMCALQHGRSIASTMGLTPVDGLPMGTRTGTLDPGVLLYLMQHEGLDAAAIQHLIYEQSGLLGVSGLSADMRELLASALPAAAEAVALFVYRVGRELGSLVAALGGLDALVFTGGIGEHAAEVRARVCRDAAWLGLKLDKAANQRHGPRISADGAVSAWVIPTDENLMVARHVRALLS